MVQESSTNSDLIPETVPLLYRAVILTALGLEYNAIQLYLKDLEKKVHPDGTIYEIGTITLNNLRWEVILVETGSHNISAAKETERALAAFKPNIVLFIGIAGGLKDVSIGDVVTATKVYGYESGKADGEFHPRPEVFSPNNFMTHLSRQIVHEKKWVNRINSPSQQLIPKAFTGAIVAGEKVISSKDSKEYKEIKNNFGDALAVEMEGLGFLQVATDHKDIDALLVRGISDLIDKKSEADASGSQEYASKNASAFAIEILANYGLLKKDKDENFEVFTRIPSNSTQSIQFSGHASKEIRNVSSVSYQGNPLISSSAIIGELLSTEYNEELNIIKKLLDELKPTMALSLLSALKERAFIKASNEVKYRILTYEAVAKIQLLKFPEGGKLLIESLQYNPDDEKSLGNAAFGYLLNQNYPKTLELVQKVLQKNPLSARAYNVIIQSKIHTESIETILPSLPQEIIHTQDVAYAIGQIYYNKDNYVESSKWLEIALNNSDSKEELLLKGLLASSLLNQVESDENNLCGLQITGETRRLLLKSIALFDDVWKCISIDPNLKKLYSSCIAERGVAKRILGMIEESSTDINDAYNIDSENPKLIHLKGLVEFEYGHFSIAESLFKKVIWDPSIPGALWLFLDSLRKQNKFDDGIKIITDLLREKRSKEHEHILYHFLIIFNIDKGREFYQAAKSIASGQVDANNNDIANIIELIKVLQFIGETDGIEPYIQKIKELNSESISIMLKLEIAEIFFNAHYFEESAAIYERIIDPKQNTVFTQKLIDAHYLGGNEKRALDLCQSLHAIHGPLPHSSTTELVIYHKIGDLGRAATICEQYLKHYPDDNEMKLNEAVVNLRSGNKEKVRDFLKEHPRFEKLSYEFGAKLAYLYYSIGMFDDAIKLAYDLRKRNYHIPDAHLDYIRLILNIEDRSPLLTKPSIIGVDSAVQLKDQFGTSLQYIICDTSVGNPVKDELRTDSDLGKQLLGKAESETIILQRTSFGNNSIQISSVLSKYVYAFQESFNTFNQLFPDNQEIYRISFGSEFDGKTFLEDKNIQQLMRQHQTNNREIIDRYKKRQFTIAALAKVIRTNVFSVCFDLSRDPNLGIFCCSGNQNERDNALKNLNSDSKLVIDPVALYTVYSLGIGDDIVKKFGKLGITQSTLDLIHLAILDFEGHKERGYIALIQEEDNLGYQLVTPDQIKNIRENFEKMLEWVRSNCEIIPCYPALNLKSAKKEEYNNIFGEASIDTILVASQPDYVLYSDDGLLLAIAKQLGSPKSVWTQLVLMDLFSSKVIPKDQLEVITIQLITRNYFHTSVNADSLLKSVDLAEGEVKTPFIEVLNCLTEGRADIDSSISVGAQFTELLWQKSLEMNLRNYLFVKLLHDLTNQREKSYIINCFIQFIGFNARLSNTQKNEILEIIQLFDTALS
jgi:nucleoside phosphorylase/transcription elongation GreA/GreB family factor